MINFLVRCRVRFIWAVCAGFTFSLIRRGVTIHVSFFLAFARLHAFYVCNCFPHASRFASRGCALPLKGDTVHFHAPCLFNCVAITPGSSFLSVFSRTVGFYVFRPKPSSHVLLYDMLSGRSTDPCVSGPSRQKADGKKCGATGGVTLLGTRVNVPKRGFQSRSSLSTLTSAWIPLLVTHKMTLLWRLSLGIRLLL